MNTRVRVLSAAALAAVVLGATAPAHAAVPAAAPTGLAAATTVTTLAAESSVGGSITRDEVIERARYWLDKNLTYSQSSSYPDSDGKYYRTDCSGYVSMALHLSTSLSTMGIGSSSDFTEISRSDLKPGDVLNNYNSHVILFAKWDDAAKTKFSYYSFGSTPVKYITGASITASWDSWPNSSYKALRYKRIVDAPTDKGMTNLTSVGDLTGDGVTDIIAVESSTGDLYRYSGPGYVGMGGRVKIGTGWNSMSTIVGTGDVTGDGVADVIAVEKATGDLYRYPGPNYNGGARVKIGSNWDSMTNIVGVGDQTGDGVPDVIAVEKATGNLYRYSGPNYVGGGGRVQIGTAWNGISTIVGVGDITGDGVADIAAVERSTGDLYRYDGPDYVGMGARTKIGVNWDSMTNIVGVGDITGDSVPDLIAVRSDTQKLYRYSGPGFSGTTAVEIGSGW
ncbi:FG-GAP repeat domain-containing protein [Streptomyces roseolus]|uniref:FG-GAP repeat domain-containing protein n=1 Tax=Streptomyces roseolus TaxID=67358 RepID=UPI00378919FD